MITRRLTVLALAAPAGMMVLPALAQEQFKVVTTFTIIADIARNVAGDAAVVESITKPGAEIHGYQPGPRDIVKAQDADLVLWNGMNLEQWFVKFFENVKDVPQAVVTDGIEPMGIAEGPYTGKPNPHAWMSPSNGLIYVENIRQALVQYDPAMPPSTMPTPQPTPPRSWRWMRRSEPGSTRSPPPNAGW